MSDWRFHLLTLPDRQWVDRDLQLQGAKVTVGLSRPDSISGRLPLGYRMINAPSGQRALTEWGSAIVAEQEGRDPVFAIVDGLTTDGDWLNVAAGGFTSYPTGMPWVDKEFSSTRVDPLDVVRLIWTNLQNKPAGDLQVVVDAVKSGQFLGKPEGAQLTAAKRHQAYMQEQLDYTKEQAEEDAKLVDQYATKALAAAGLPAGGLLIRSTSEPTGDKRSKRNLWFKGNAEGLLSASTWNGKKWVELSTAKFNAASDWFFEWLDQKEVLKDSKAMHTKTKEEFNTAKSKVSELSEQKAEPYTLSWWDTPDVGSIITDLATQTPFDYREETTWDGDDALSHRLRIGYPEFGVRREHLRLEIGVNVTAPPPLVEGDYASEVMVLGAGEGRSMVRSTAVRDAGRLRRALVLERKEFTKTTQTGREARNELEARTSDWTFDSLSLVDHDMCPYGSFDAGDWLYLTGDAGWVQLDQWVRVREIEIDCPTGQIILKVSSS
ncbi:hypothetical protein DFO58_3311 [Arthrobacter sp. AG1021]|uniref:hypothetical protein n=1 Tax=Arthrobacter sp. AG1021 TaxID=2183908 RepID=UPI000EB03191|nr:hypothetical protein [Arthrobacter sp. AG1021]RKS16754.1 hypothetical protein DFO58_3311 [Arthrobacter sp. AG1021]